VFSELRSLVSFTPLVLPMPKNRYFDFPLIKILTSAHCYCSILELWEDNDPVILYSEVRLRCFIIPGSKLTQFVHFTQNFCARYFDTQI
jgi:hypothetical protein